MAYVHRAKLTVAVTDSGVEVPVADHVDGGATVSLTFNQSSGETMFYVAPGVTAAATGTPIPSGDGNAQPVDGVRVRDGNPSLWVDDAGPHNCEVDVWEIR